MKKSVKGFTLIEILTVLAIMAILIGVLVPALMMARNTALNAKQKVQLTSIEQGLFSFRNDTGEYPPSNRDPAIAPPPNAGYGGAQKLAEALLGWDLLGFNRLSMWRPDGSDGTKMVYYTGTDKVQLQINLAQRRPKYLDLEKANAFTLQQLVGGAYNNMIGAYPRFDQVLCDVFGRVRVNIGAQSVNAGTPILYYRANPSGYGVLQRKIDMPNSIYNYYDNDELANIVNMPDTWEVEEFINFITDPKAMVQKQKGAYPWPYKPDSYILISAGIDGIYGTPDDITNFGQ